MLKSLYLLRSKIRRDLLALFFTNPSERFYLRELERRLGYSAGNIRRELLRFREDELLRTEKVGNLLYYSLNDEHPLFAEIQSIVAKTVGVEGALREELSSVGDIKIAFVYGSFAAERAGAASDIDVMVIGDPDMSTLNETVGGLENRLRREINVTVYSAKEFKARKRAHSGFVLDLLNSPRIMLIGEEDELLA